MARQRCGGLPLLVALCLISLVARGEEQESGSFKTFTSEWEERYNQELRTSSESCVTC